jgi:hypothetical protein
MSITNHVVQSVLPQTNAARRAVSYLACAAALETLLTIGHFGYGAHVYDDPARLHVVGPAAGFLLLLGVLAALYVWRPRWWTLAPLLLEIAVVYVGLFGGYHGLVNHAAKDVLYWTGTSAERLAEIFDSPDFTVPNNVLYELTGLATPVVAGFVAYYAVRVVRAFRKGE